MKPEQLLGLMTFLGEMEQWVSATTRCGVAKFAADGPGRLSTSVSRACWTGHRQVARRGPPRATTGWPDRQDEAPQVELLADSASEPGATRARSSSNRPLEPLVSQSRSTPIAVRCGTYRSEPYHLRGQQFAAINFAFERPRNAAMRMDFQTIRQMMVAKGYPIWCYEERVPRRLDRHLSAAT